MPKSPLGQPERSGPAVSARAGSFVSPLVESRTKAPDPAKVKAACNTYLEKLKLAG
jgi:hypothetical protein